MSHASHAEAGHAGHRGESHASHYIKIWGALCVLLIISFVGPMLGHPVLTLITAFGIAIVKAWMVAGKFMHLNIEKKYISMLMITMVAAVLLFWFAIAPDILKHEGQRWTNDSARHPAQGGFATARDTGHGHSSGGGHH